MANPKVRGYPEGGPYHTVEIDEENYTVTFKETRSGKLIRTAWTKNDASVASGKLPAHIEKKAFRQAYAVFKKSKSTKKPT